MYEQVVVSLHITHLLETVCELPLETSRVDFVYRSREHHRFARLEVHLEHSWNEKILAAVESATILIRIGHAVVPIWLILECSRIGSLEMKVWKSIIHAE